MAKRNKITNSIKPIVKTNLFSVSRFLPLPRDMYLLTVILLCVVNILIRLPFLSLPAVGDESIYFTATQAIAKNNLNPFTDYFAYKPGGFFLFTAILFKIFSPSRELAHLFAYVCSSCALLLMYLVGSNTIGKRVTFYAVLLLGISPIFFIQSFLYLDGLFVASVLLITFYAYVNRRVLMYIILGTLLVMTREPTVLIICVFWMYELFSLFKTKKLSWKSLLYSCKYLVPLAIFFLWMCINKQVFGWYLFPVSIQTIDVRISSLLYKTKDIFIRTGLWSLFALAVTGLIGSTTDRIHGKKLPNFTLFFVIFLVYTMFCAVSLEYPRYMLPVYPFLYLIAVWTLHQLFSVKKMYIILGILAGILISSWTIQIVKHPISTAWGEDDLIRIITIDRNTITYIQREFPNATIITNYAEDIRIYTDPFLGYVEQHTKFPNALYWNCNADSGKEQLRTLQKQTQHRATPILFIDTSSYSGTCTYPPTHMQFLQRIYGVSFDRQTIHDIYLITQ